MASERILGQPEEQQFFDQFAGDWSRDSDMSVTCGTTHPLGCLVRQTSWPLI